MSQLTIQSLVLPAASLNGENPLTPLRPYDTASAAGIPVRRGGEPYPDRGQEANILPYRLQDQYDRNRRARAFKTAVLENKHLRATFVLDLGGRMWSLVHKPSGRELLFSNPVFQPANLAVRDAWFTGGVEWNIGIIGHCPLTCSPLFAARVLADDGSPVLRLYEWERVRRVPFQIDCWLPDESQFLMVRVKISNPNDHAVPMYWWSNIAVNEEKDVRVLGPASRAYRHDYDGTLVTHEVPMYNGVDVTYTTNRLGAADLYFQIPPGHRPWVTALDGDGRGLVHSSTNRLIGRKMFNWGVHPGGKRWQEFLAERGCAYLEIQGGLATTQSEYLTMPAGAQWSWLEAYGPLQAPAPLVHGSDWSVACEAVEAALERALPRALLDAQLERTTVMADREPQEVLHHGSGWGALEDRRRMDSGERPLSSAATPFLQQTLGEEQAPWLALLEQGTLPARQPRDTPHSPMVQPEWRRLLERSVQSDPHWLAWYHLGVMRFRDGDHDGARAAWEQSLALEQNCWARRDLAVLARDRSDHHAAADQWLAAAKIAPECGPLAVECCQALLRAERHQDLLHFVATLPPQVRALGRVRMLNAFAALRCGDLETVEHYFDGEVDIANIREKETSLSDLWFGWHEQRLSRERGIEVNDELRRAVRSDFPPPMRFDFRIRSE